MKKPAHKARTVGKAHQHARPAGHGAAAHHPAHPHKHVTAKKHHTQAKKHKGAHTQAKKRGLAAGSAVACCAAEALAASLRLQGLAVTDDDVLALYWRTASDPDAGASILDTLTAAAESGLAGVRPAGFATIDLDRVSGECMRPWRRGLSEELDSPQGKGEVAGFESRPGLRVPVAQGEERSLSDVLILGVELSGPHTVLATPEGWWSWGELWCPCEFPAAVIEEAWVISWR